VRRRRAAQICNKDSVAEWGGFAGKGDSDGGSVDVDFGDCAFNASYTHVTPGSLICLSTANANQLHWDFIGSLAGGTSGHVSYEVRVDN
jgi:hypothetical protein